MSTEPVVVFATDDPNKARFLRHMDELRVMGKLEGKLISCIGSFNGTLELSYLMTCNDYINHVLPFSYTKGQESVLYVKDMTAYLVFNYKFSRSPIELGPLVQVTHDKAMSCKSWTHRLDTGQYWTTER